MPADGTGPGLCAERVTLVLHGGKLLAKVGLTGRFGCLGGELIDLRGQTIDLPLELLVLGKTSARLLSSASESLAAAA